MYQYMHAFIIVSFSMSPNALEPRSTSSDIRLYTSLLQASHACYSL